MTKYIKKLTSAQSARMPEWRDKWIDLGLCTDPADRPRFEAAVAECYACANLPPPKRVIWVSSPIVGAMAAPIAAHLLTADSSRSAVGLAVRSAVDADVRSAVEEAVRSAVGSTAENELQEIVTKEWRAFIGGQFWVGWYYGPAYSTFFTDVCGLELRPDIMRALQANADQSQSAGWWWPHRYFVIACDRPRVIRRDDQGRLHCADGPAIAWRDGWGLYFWHGTRVPDEWIIDPKSMTPELALNHKNLEQRRAAAEIMGWARVLDLLNPRVIDADHPAVGVLLEADLPDAPKTRFLKVRCATGRDFCLVVPREVETAFDANLMLYYSDEDGPSLSASRRKAIKRAMIEERT